MKIRWINFKEEISAETLGALPKVQLINRVTGIQGVSVTKQIATNDQKDNSNTFSQVLAKECRKQPKQENKDPKQKEGSDLTNMQASMAYYNNLAKPVYFTMTFSATDLKG